MINMAWSTHGYLTLTINISERYNKFSMCTSHWNETKFFKFSSSFKWYKCPISSVWLFGFRLISLKQLFYCKKGEYAISIIEWNGVGVAAKQELQIGCFYAMKSGLGFWIWPSMYAVRVGGGVGIVSGTWLKQCNSFIDVVWTHKFGLMWVNIESG